MIYHRIKKKKKSLNELTFDTIMFLKFNSLTGIYRYYLVRDYTSKNNHYKLCFLLGKLMLTG